MSDYLHPISDREPLAWIIAKQRTALGAHRWREANRLKPSDRLFLYTTRGCFRNPRDGRGRVIGIARVASAPRKAPRPVSFGGREFPFEIPLTIECLARLHDGVELAPLVSQLKTFPNKSAWPTYLRRALAPIEEGDAALLEAALDPVCHHYRDAAPSYVLLRVQRESR